MWSKFRTKVRRTSSKDGENESPLSENLREPQTASQARIPSHIPIHEDDTQTPVQAPQVRPSQASLHRNSSGAHSTLSTFAELAVSPPITRTLTLSPWEEQKDPLGLNVVWEPEGTRSLDIIFIHGLGGTSRSTWSKNRDPEFFWPGKWLPQEPEICTARVLSFGYDADWRSTAGRSAFSILDFAKELLFSMKFSKNTERDLEDLHIGEVPIIFVVHSMGGLVAKQAYILGLNDPDYQDIVQSISAVLFLSTPHRGSNLAELLNRILSASFLKFSPKQYIGDLNKNSPALESINEQFRKIAPRLQIVSFYETLETVVGPKRYMVLEKDSAILGYPGEISRSLKADHHDVCKYSSQTDASYISVRDVLKTLVDRLRGTGPSVPQSSIAEDTAHIESVLAVSERPDDDFNYFHDRWMPGTCEWILENSSFNHWLEFSTSTRILWLHALPANGKSILSSFIINYLKEKELCVQFFFFRFNDISKRSVNGFLRSMAYQIAQDLPQFRQKLKELSLQGLQLEKADARTIWQKLFVSGLFKLSIPTLYWVVDALDECDAPHMLLDFIGGMRSAALPIRLLLVSRKTHVQTVAFDRLSGLFDVQDCQIDGANSDIRLYVKNRIQYQRWDSDFREHVSQKIFERAAGNFLWVFLALEEVLNRHTRDDIETAIDDMPSGMKALYQRMDSAISQNSGPNDKRLAKLLLTWTTCARRTMTLKELTSAIAPEFAQIPDLRNTIPEICGQFVVVDMKNQVTMIHQTARDFLTTIPELHFYIDTRKGHEELFARCMSFLLDPSLRGKVTQASTQVHQNLLSYSTTSWSYHLNHSSSTSTQTLTLLRKFLKGPFVLTWIQALAIHRELKVLVYASKALTSTVQRKRRSGERGSLQDLQDIELLEVWAVDFLKILGKFSYHLLQDPSSIHRFIPQLCPRNSQIYRQFAKGGSSASFKMSGLTYEDWDDSIARLSILRGIQPSEITVAGRHIAVLTSGPNENGTICIWNSSNYAEVTRLRHDEYVTKMAFNTIGDKLVTCGFFSTKVWQLPLGHMVSNVANPKETRVLAVTFLDDDTIWTASDDKVVRKLATNNSAQDWLETQSLKEDVQIGGGYANSPSCIAFNQDTSQVAVAYRGFPLSVWSTEEHTLIGRCRRQYHGPSGSGNTWTAVDRVSWNSLTGDVLGLYNDGCVLKWNPYDEESYELRSPATDIECSPDGMCFATCDSSGTVKIFNFETFGLLYKLSCEASPIGLAFSPDCRRIYDLRETYCTVWEPNALVRFYEPHDRNEDSVSDIGSSTLIQSTYGDANGNSDPITAVSVSQDGNFFATGNEDGVVTLHDRSGDAIMEIFSSPRYMMIDHMTWGGQNDRIAIAELGGDIIIMTLEPPPRTSKGMPWTIMSNFGMKPNPELGGVQQLLFNSDCSALLASYQQSNQIWGIANGSTKLLLEAQAGQNLRWSNIANSKDQLIAYDFHGIHLHSWSDLSNGAGLSFDSRLLRVVNVFLPKSSPDRHEERFDGVKDSKAIRLLAPMPGNNYSIIDTVGRTGEKEFQGPIIVDTTLLQRSQSSDLLSIYPSHEISTVHIPNGIAELVELPVGILQKDMLVFFDKDYWVCTWRLGAGGAGPTGTKAPRRHFFLPRDWISADVSMFTHLAADGTLFVPRNGKIVVIATALISEW